MSIAQASSLNSPFIDGVYQGSITVTVEQDTNSKSFLIDVLGERISLKTFQGEYLEKMQSIFGEKVTPFAHELSDMREIFGNSEARATFADEQPQEDEKLIKRINFNAKRAIEGNPFTGFAIVENTTEKIIGFVTVGRGALVGESESAIILNPKYWGERYGMEAILLAGALALSYVKQGYKVGSRFRKIPVEKFTISAKESNTKAVELAKKLGMEKIRELTPKERYTDEPSYLYGIDAKDVEASLFKWIDPSSLQLNLPPL